MKKLLVVLLALTALGATAFAEVTWTWGSVLDTGVVITAANAGPVMAAINDNDSGGNTRFRINGAVAAGDVGTKFRLAFPSDLIGVAPATQIDLVTKWFVWGNLFSNMVTFEVGKGTDTWTDTVNKGWGGIGRSAEVAVFPIENLTIAAGVTVPFPANTLDWMVASADIGAKYVMPDLVDVRLTYINAPGANLSGLAAGVNVLAVPNLVAQFELNLTNLGAASGQQIELFENVEYTMGDLHAGLNLDELLDNASGWNVPIAINPSVDYNVMAGTNVGISVTYTLNVGGTTASKLVADPWVKFTLSDNAKVKIDAAYTIPDLSATSTWTLPINVNFLWSF